MLAYISSSLKMPSQNFFSVYRGFFLTAHCYLFLSYKPTINSYEIQTILSLCTGRKLFQKCLKCFMNLQYAKQVFQCPSLSTCIYNRFEKTEIQAIMLSNFTKIQCI